ncbi:FUSC family protein [Caproiciproducens sp. LBM24188]|nr:hypothetical protein [Oscillospiraceae bacterium]
MNWLKALFAKHRMGLRIVKTGIAVTVCVVITVLLKIDHPFFAVVATVMSLGKSIDISVKAGRNKIFGVLIGTAIGYGFALLAPANAGLLGIGVMLTLYLCHLLKLNGAATLSCFAFAAMMLPSSFTVHPVTWRFALTCVEGSVIGIVIAVLVNLLIMPPNYVEEVKKASAQLRCQIQNAMEDAAERRPLDIRGAKAAIERLNYNVSLYVAEAKFLRWNDQEVFQISCQISTYQMVLDELKAVQVMELEKKDGELSPEMEAVYRYHMGRMRKLFESIADPNAAVDPKTNPESK